MIAFLSPWAMFDRMAEDPDMPEPPESDLDAAVEEMRGKPTKVTPAEGIQQMADRIHYLRRSCDALLAHADAQTSVAFDTTMQNVRRYRKEIADCQRRLVEYKTQEKGRN